MCPPFWPANLAAFFAGELLFLKMRSPFLTANLATGLGPWGPMGGQGDFFHGNLLVLKIRSPSLTANLATGLGPWGPRGIFPLKVFFSEHPPSFFACQPSGLLAGRLAGRPAGRNLKAALGKLDLTRQSCRHQILDRNQLLDRSLGYVTMHGICNNAQNR